MLQPGERVPVGAFVELAPDSLEERLDRLPGLGHDLLPQQPGDPREPLQEFVGEVFVCRGAFLDRLELLQQVGAGRDRPLEDP